MGAGAQGYFTVTAIERDTGKAVWSKTSKNTVTTEGLAFIAAAMTGGPNMHPTNSSLNATVLRTSADTTGGFTSTGGPMTTQARVDATGKAVSSGGTPIYHNPPDAGTPIRLRWFDASNNTYTIWGASFGDGTNTLASAQFTPAPADKTASQIIVVEYTMSMSVSAPLHGNAGLALLRMLSGAGSAAIVANVTTADATNPAATIGSITSEDAVVTIPISYPNQSTDIRNKRISGFTLAVRNNNGTVPVIVHVADPRTERIPAPGGGEVAWAVTITFGTAGTGLTARITPGFVNLNQGNLFSADLTIVASGGSGAWGFERQTTGPGLTTLLTSSDTSGDVATWVVQVKSSSGNRGTGEFRGIITRGSDSYTVRAVVQYETR